MFHPIDVLFREDESFQFAQRHIKIRDQVEEFHLRNPVVSKMRSVITRVLMEGDFALLATIALVKAIGLTIFAGGAYLISLLLPNHWDLRNNLLRYSVDSVEPIVMNVNFLIFNLLALLFNPFEYQLMYTGFYEKGAKGDVQNANSVFWNYVDNIFADDD